MPRLRPLHWRRLPLSDVEAEGAAWAAVREKAAAVDLNLERLASLFGERTAPARQSGGAARKGPARARQGGGDGSAPSSQPRGGEAAESAEVCLLTTTRSQHLLITLSRFSRAATMRGGEVGEGGPTMLVLRAVAELDPLVLAADDLPKLLSCLPSEEEEAALASFGGDPLTLATADYLQWRLLKLTRTRARLEVYLTATTLEAQCRTLSRQLDHVCAGCEQLLHSPLLLHTLGLILALGNAMNCRSARLGSAGGFGLEILASLMGVKATPVPPQGGGPPAQTTTTLMHFVARQLAARGVKAAELKAELQSVPNAANVDFEETARECEELLAQKDGLRRELVFAIDEMRERGELPDGGGGASGGRGDGAAGGKAASEEGPTQAGAPEGEERAAGRVGEGEDAAGKTPPDDEAAVAKACRAVAEAHLHEVAPPLIGEGFDPEAVACFATRRFVSRLGDVEPDAKARPPALDISPP